MTPTDRRTFCLRITLLGVSLILMTGVALVGYHYFSFLEYGGPKVSFVDRVEDPVLLLDGLPSYGSATEVRRWLEARGLLVDNEKMTPGPGPPRPPFDFLRLTVNDYQIGDCEGRTEYVLFNDRLLETVFWPSNCEQSLDEIARNGTVDTSSESQYLHIVKHEVDFQERRYVSWMDDRLDHETDLWIKRHS